jgi:hypothetical protein
VLSARSSIVTSAAQQEPSHWVSPSAGGSRGGGGDEEDLHLIPIHELAADEANPARIMAVAEKDALEQVICHTKGHSPCQNSLENSLKLVGAWRVQNLPVWRLYDAERRRIARDCKHVARDLGKYATTRENGVLTPSFSPLRRAEKDGMRSQMPFNFLQTKTAGLPNSRNLRSDIHEAWLLHGTDQETLLSVLLSGLDERYSRGSGRSVWGQGCYFAVRCSLCARNSAFPKASKWFKSMGHLQRQNAFFHGH